MNRWPEFFGQFSFEMKYKTGVSNVVADALSRPPHVSIASSTFLIVGEDYEFMQLIQNSYSNDRNCVAVLQALRQSDQSKDAVPVIRGPQVEEVLLRVLHDFHDSAVVSHPGIQRTFSAIRQYFWWSSMQEHIDQYVET
ncbi:hypothetical protein PsorP6_017716 [Peronosclerospora sorghi]|uniref:Uncharacterized protein n=1 Tax=Peronosclerospora sorghi TaxID=230839 RepID=A0ACC0WL42_9STRA|nr:hypothetical protein PsorP6_017716 [Peronosclerospora sorghi]